MLSERASPENVVSRLSLPECRSCSFASPRARQGLLGAVGPGSAGELRVISHRKPSPALTASLRRLCLRALSSDSVELADPAANGSRDSSPADLGELAPAFAVSDEQMGTAIIQPFGLGSRQYMLAYLSPDEGSTMLRYPEIAPVLGRLAQSLRDQANRARTVGYDTPTPNGWIASGSDATRDPRLAASLADLTGKETVFENLHTEFAKLL